MDHDNISVLESRSSGNVENGPFNVHRFIGSKHLDFYIFEGLQSRYNLQKKPYRNIAKPYCKGIPSTFIVERYEWSEKGAYLRIQRADCSSLYPQAHGPTRTGCRQW